jgi:hypothetical protein
MFKIYDLLNAGVEYIPNPMAESTELDEDFVGRTCKLTRKVSPKQVVIKTLQKHFVAVATELESDSD